MGRKIIIIVGLSLLLLPINVWAAWTTYRLTWNSGDSRYAAVAIDANNHIHCVWNDSTPGNDEIHYRKSTDGGTSWTTRRLSWNSGSSEYPDIAVDSNYHIHVVWHDDTSGNSEIYYKKSTDGGISWMTQALTMNTGHSMYPSIATDTNNHIHAVWMDSTPGNAEIYYKKSTNGGSTWISRRLTWNSTSSQMPAMVIGSNNHVHVVWYDDAPGNFEIFYKRSTDGGATWSARRLTYNTGSSDQPSIAVDSNNYLHVVWRDYSPGSEEILYKKSTDGGASWTTRRLTYNSGYSTVPAICADSNNHIHVVWHDYTPGNYEVFYKTSTDGGTSWASQRLTWNSGLSIWPDIAADSSNHIYVLWHDETPGNAEIFCKKN